MLSQDKSMGLESDLTHWKPNRFLASFVNAIYSASVVDNAPIHDGPKEALTSN
jgi:hypothetical protein